MEIPAPKIHEVIAAFLHDMREDAGWAEIKPVLQALQEYLRQAGYAAAIDDGQYLFLDSFDRVRFQDVAGFCRDYVPVKFLVPLADQLLACLNLRRLFRWSAGQGFYAAGCAREICWLLFLAEAELERADLLGRLFRRMIERGRPPTSEFAGDLLALQRAQEDWWCRLPRMKKVIEGVFVVLDVDARRHRCLLHDISSGQKIGPVVLTPESSRHLRPSDGFTAEVGFDAEQWHLLSVGPLHPGFLLGEGDEAESNGRGLNV